MIEMSKISKREQARCTEENWPGRERCVACPIYKLVTSQTDPKMLAWLAQVLDPIEIHRFEPGEMVCRVGEKGRYLFSVRAGIFKAVRYGQGGEYRIVHLFRNGESFGLELLTNPHFDHSVVAIESAEACQIPLSVIRTVEEKVPDLCTPLMEEWHDQLRQAETWIVQFSTGTVRSRLARLIIYLSLWNSGEKINTVRLLPGRELAAILGATPESISRVIARWKRQKFLQRLPEMGAETYRFDRTQLKQAAEDSSASS
ncbi:cyclic nucleotide-binding protein [Nitrosococcus oceani ATCC 19707]|uniref:Cyclic nucleotide-binding protein n=2 Tax=Nitrosococcus oceani TaxID=1229 RepID=Q3JAP3_NITOC|nr:Crp/Fnr family transcriptional regulator [Nitrosococcus oceani]ABA58103.1 cyclic nucleotide-binding protein [Nitrosococcus oceani ATCC 19707]EDZ66894.1 cyclic nucleotide-binding domain protein [Nitrosococcus oceani AFC27]KFI19433.1 cyclic nucleotide-binding protein [Nitrosococcus oceani C-27]GEM21275.1 cyclic nucleotide-binding protein [Nitrosococcus oceani]